MASTNQTSKPQTDTVGAVSDDNASAEETGVRFEDVAAAKTFESVDSTVMFESATLTDLS